MALALAFGGAGPVIVVVIYRLQPRVLRLIANIANMAYGIWHIACLARISAANLNPGAQVFSELCASGWPIKVSYGIAIEQLGHRCV